MSVPAFRFQHGLGDTANFCRLAQLWRARGHRLAVETDPTKRWLFEAAGIEVVPHAPRIHDWGYPAEGSHDGPGKHWHGNKISANLVRDPLPLIGTRTSLWDELCCEVLDVTPAVPETSAEAVDRWLSGLPQPWVCLHAVGNTNQARKSLSRELQLALYERFLAESDGTLIVLDWDARVPVPRSPRIRHVVRELQRVGLPELVHLLSRSDLLVGIDSGPLHLAGICGAKALGLWQPGHYPATYTIPRLGDEPPTVNLVLEEHTRRWNLWRRVPYRIVAQPGATWDPDWIWRQVRRALESNPYGLGLAGLPLEQLVAERCRGRGDFVHVDRHRSFDALLRRWPRGTPCRIVETGTIRSADDWGAGYATYLLGLWCWLRADGSTLDSVDTSPESVRFALRHADDFHGLLRLHTSRGDDYLRSREEPIDVLYLDSHDADQPGHAETCLGELQAAERLLHPQSLVLIDDTPWEGDWLGKGRLVVPYLLERGWRILYGGHQVLLGRSV